MSPEGKTSPQLLSDVVHAVANLNEINGSTARTIADCVLKAISRSSRSHRPRNLPDDIRQALIDGVEVGFLTKRDRRYKLDSMRPLHIDDDVSDDPESENSGDDQYDCKDAAAPGTPKAPERAKSTRKHRKRVRTTKRKIAKSKSKKRVPSQKRSRSRRQRGRPRQASATSTEVSRENTPKPTPEEPKPEAQPVPEPKPTEEEAPSTSGRRRRKRHTRAAARDGEVQDMDVMECPGDPEMAPTSCDNEDCICHLEAQHLGNTMEPEEDKTLDYIN